MDFKFQNNYTLNPSRRLQETIRNQLTHSLFLTESNPLHECVQSSLNLRGMELSQSLLLKSLFVSSYITAITSLDISYCHVNESTLRIFSSHLQNLANLSASSCQLTDVHCSQILWPLTLKFVNLSRNCLAQCPEGLGDLVNLSYLNLNGNAISLLDKTLLQLPSLTRLDLLNNPIENVPKDICRQGVTAMQRYFQISPIFPKQSSVDSDYSSDHCSLTTVDSASSIDTESLEQDWFNPLYTPSNFTSVFQNSFCRVFLPKDVELDVTVKIVHDCSLHPLVQSNELLITPVISIEPHGYQFPQNTYAMIVLPHCTLIEQSSIQFIPMYSNTSLQEQPVWNYSSQLELEVFEDCAVIYTTHFSLFAVISYFPYPSNEIAVSPEKGETLLIHEFPNFQICISPKSVDRLTQFKATVYYSDPPYHREHEQSLASACIAVKPHNIKLNLPVTVHLPIPNYSQIVHQFPYAQLSLLTANDDCLNWIPVVNEDMLVHVSDDIVVFSVNHFSFFKFVWDISVDSMKKLTYGALYAYRYIRTQYIGVRCQVFMSPPSPITLKFPLLVIVFKFGDPLREPCNYKWMLADTGEKRHMVKTGEVSFHITGYCFEIVNDEENGLSKDFIGQDFCLEAEFLLQMRSDMLAIPDYEVLGEICLTQTSDQKICFKKKLIKPPESISEGINNTKLLTQYKTMTMTPPDTPLDEVPNLTSNGVRKSKRRLSYSIKGGAITSDSELMDIAQDIRLEWEKLYPYLNVPYEEVESIRIQYKGQNSELLAYHMLQRWHRMAGDDCNYNELRLALEKVGLQPVAYKYCYVNN